jgi:chromosome segregation ATPase
MSIHLGEIVQKTVEVKRLTYKEFGALIHRNEKTIPDIYERAAMSTDLLLAISKALNTDFFALFYLEEPLKSLRNDGVGSLNSQIQACNERIQKITEENNRLLIELTLTQELVKSQKDTIAFAKEQIEQYKIKLAGVSTV